MPSTVAVGPRHLGQCVELLDVGGRDRRGRAGAGVERLHVARRGRTARRGWSPSTMLSKVELRPLLKTRTPDEEADARARSPGAHQQAHLAGEQVAQGQPEHSARRLVGEPRGPAGGSSSRGSASRSGCAELVDDPGRRRGRPPGRVGRGDRVVGHHHDGLAELVDAAPQEARAPRRPTWSRGCRWARRRRRSRAC